MNKSILTIATILALGTIGCASAGTQYAGTVPGSKASSAQYSAGGLGTLWEPSRPDTSTPQQVVATQRVVGDLWNGAPVVTSFDTSAPKADPKGTFSATSTTLKF